MTKLTDFVGSAVELATEVVRSTRLVPIDPFYFSVVALELLNLVVQAAQRVLAGALDACKLFLQQPGSVSMHLAKVVGTLEDGLGV